MFAPKRGGHLGPCSLGASIASSVLPLDLCLSVCVLVRSLVGLFAFAVVSLQPLFALRSH